VLMSAVPVLVRRHYFFRGVQHAVRDSARQRELMRDGGGVEYRALGCIVRVILAYFVIAQVAVAVGWGLYLSASRVDASQLHATPWWWAFFHAVASFNNAGFSTMPDNMVPFATDAAILLPSAALILLGSVAYPVAVRILVAALARLPWVDQAAYQYLLAHPRKCFTHLFSARHSLILAGTVVAILVVEVAVFVGLDVRLPNFQQFSTSDMVLMGFYQGVSSRHAGFSVVDLSLVAPGVTLAYLIFMYLTAYPFLFLERRSGQSARASATEEQVPPSPVHDIEARLPLGGASLAAMARRRRGRAHSDAAAVPTVPARTRLVRFEMGSYEDHALATPLAAPAVADSSAAAFARNVLAADVFWLGLAWFAIAVAESYQLVVDPHRDRLSLYAVLFELVSAYGNVGLTLGYPGVSYSLSGRFSPCSKCVVIAVMLAGRHRGLPRSIDAAVYLPSLFNTAPPAAPADPAELDAVQLSYRVLGLALHSGRRAARDAFAKSPSRYSPPARTELHSAVAVRISVDAFEGNKDTASAPGSVESTRDSVDDGLHGQTARCVGEEKHVQGGADCDASVVDTAEPTVDTGYQVPAEAICCSTPVEADAVDTPP
jgi:hypothetical protein